MQRSRDPYFQRRANTAELSVSVFRAALRDMQVDLEEANTLLTTAQTSLAAVTPATGSETAYSDTVTALGNAGTHVTNARQRAPL